MSAKTNGKVPSFSSEVRRMVLEFLPVLTATDDAEVVDETMRSWEEVFKMAWPVPEGADEQEMINQFALFIRSLIPVTNVGNVKVRSGLVRDYGKARLSFEIEDYAPRTKAGIQAGFDRCFQTVKLEHERYINEFLTGEQVQSGADDKNTNPAVETIEMPCDKLSIRWEGDKAQVRAHGGNFTKWGVPVYEEVLEASGIDPEQMPAKGQVTKGWRMTVKMRGGKPAKVTAFEQP